MRNKLSYFHILLTLAAIAIATTAFKYLFEPHKTLEASNGGSLPQEIRNTESEMTDQKIEYKGREIIIPQKYSNLGDDSKARSLSTDTEQNTIEIFLDGEKLTGGMTGAGKFFLKKYAYDPQDSIVDLVKKYVDHLDARNKAKDQPKQEASQ